MLPRSGLMPTQTDQVQAARKYAGRKAQATSGTAKPRIGTMMNAQTSTLTGGYSYIATPDHRSPTTTGITGAPPPAPKPSGGR